jgi:hypothetical protein
MHSTIKIPFAFAAAVLSLALAACESPPNMQDYNHSFGEAVNYNIAVQTVDPTPDDAIYAPTFDGDRTDLMMQRYRADEVKQPGPLRTSGIGSTSGAYGNGGTDMGGAGQ